MQGKQALRVPAEFVPAVESFSVPSNGLPGWQLSPSLLTWKAAGSSEDRNLQLCMVFLLRPAAKDVLSFGRRRYQLSTASLLIFTLECHVQLRSVLLLSLSSSIYHSYDP